MQVTDADMHHLTRRGVEMLSSSVKPPLPPILILKNEKTLARRGPTDSDMHHSAVLARRLPSHSGNIKIGGRGN